MRKADFQWRGLLIKNHRDLIDAEFVLNHDGGGVLADHGKPVMMEVDATEKLYGDFVLTATNSAATVPARPENAIYELADALTRIQHYSFPSSSTTSRARFTSGRQDRNAGTRGRSEGDAETPPDMEAVAAVEGSAGQLDHAHHLRGDALKRSHANNALPQMAQANINCRIEPGHSLEEIRLTLEKVVADRKVKVQYRDNDNQLLDHGSDRHSFVPPAPRKEVFDALDKVVAQMWRDSGASDHGHGSVRRRLHERRGNADLLRVRRTI